MIDDKKLDEIFDRELQKHKLYNYTDWDKFKRKVEIYDELMIKQSNSDKGGDKNDA